jgi:uncharacterized protein YidB (DUF937 family)
MFDQLFDTFKSNISNTLAGDENLNGTDHQEVATEASSSIIDSLKNLTQNGDFSAVQEMFSGQETQAGAMASSPLSSNLIQNLMQKFGLDSNAASGLVSKIIPSVMNHFNKNVGDAQQSGGFDINSIISSFTGGNASGGISDLISKFTGGGNSNTTQNTGGGILDTIKSLFK